MKLVLQSISSLAVFLVLLGFHHPLIAGPISREELATKKVYTSFTEALQEPQEVYRLDISGLELKEIPKAIVKLVNLQELDLSHNRLSELAAPIASLQNLEYIDLGYNNFKSIPAGLDELRNLKHLNLKGNKISGFNNSLTKLNRLEALDLAGNELEAISFSKGALTQLKYLNLENNQLASLPDFSPLENLQSLALGHNALTGNVFLKLEQNKNLRHLLLNNNLLRNLDELKEAKVSELKSLEYLNLSANSLTALPAEIEKLSSLKRLDIDQNKLSVLPPELKNLNHLAQLGAADNQFSSFPEQVLDIPQLSSLSLGNNNITALPEQIQQLSGLKNLYLNGTNISGSSPGFKLLGGLDTLDIEGIPLSTEEVMELYLANSPALIYYHDKHNNSSFFLKQLFSDDKEYLSGLLAACDAGEGQSCFDLARFNKRNGLDEAADFYYAKTVLHSEKGGFLNLEASFALAELLEKRLEEPNYLDKDDLDYTRLLSDTIFTAYSNICNLDITDSTAAEVQALSCQKSAQILDSQVRIYKAALSQYTRDVERISGSSPVSATGYADAVKGEMDKKLKLTQLNAKIDKLRQAIEYLQQESSKYTEKAN
ncbi:Miro domain-containing protein [Flammeovirgaceae bacterium 311]|nr:Miro domain-containing protein [Flammeovirgaceae bacterium 311]